MLCALPDQARPNPQLSLPRCVCCERGLHPSALGSPALNSRWACLLCAGSVLTRGDDLRKALAGGEENEELAEVCEQAEVQEEHQKEIAKCTYAEPKACKSSQVVTRHDSSNACHQHLAFAKNYFCLHA